MGEDYLMQNDMVSCKLYLSLTLFLSSSPFYQTRCKSSRNFVSSDWQVRVDVTGNETQRVFDLVLTNLAKTAPPIPGFRRQKGGNILNPVDQNQTFFQFKVCNFCIFIEFLWYSFHVHSIFSRENNSSEWSNFSLYCLRCGSLSGFLVTLVR